MGLAEDVDDDIFKKHKELSLNLNLDTESADQAWKSYETIRQNYTLEGNQLHWLGCALYVACRKTSTPTVGRSDAVVEGNCVSLTGLLRLCKLSLIQFFSKSKQWADMANMSLDFRRKIDVLEKNFAVSMVIFRKYQPIFVDMFLNPVDDQPRQKSRKQRNLPCTSARVFEFCWTLFVCIKGQLKEYGDDLVNSYHLLLACCDLVLGNAIVADRKDLVNPNFPGLPTDWSSSDFLPPLDPPCIIDILCDRHDGIPLEAKIIKEYCWKDQIRKLFERRILRGDARNSTGLLDQGNFDHNMKAVNKEYEAFMLSVGDFDERIFLGDDANADIGSPARLGTGDISEELQAKRADSSSGNIGQLVPDTPLTGRHYLSARELPGATPLTTATNSVTHLYALVSSRKPAPSEKLEEMFKMYGISNESVENQFKEYADRFCARYVQNTDQQNSEQQNIGGIDFAKKRLEMAKTLFYKLLEDILLDEKKKKPGVDLNSMLQQDLFHQCLFACSVEIVIYSYKSQKVFPWILDVLNLHPFYFYKIIEPVVSTKDHLSRDIVKHLNTIEERILESMAWKNDSPLWTKINDCQLPIPPCTDVNLPGQLTQAPATGSSDGTETQNSIEGIPISRVVQIDRSGMQQSSHIQRSPVITNSMLQSPVTSSVVKKKLSFQDEPMQGTITIKPGQSLLQSNVSMQNSTSNMYIAINSDGNKKLIPVAAVLQTVPKEQKPKRNDSLALFFRKFYHLASVRMIELCNKLDIPNKDLRHKIWTCFEHSIINHIDLMKDRHLDQILMCTVYVVCKVAQIERSFTEIMRCYRFQPQSASHVYRSVLLQRITRREPSVDNQTDQTVNGQEVSSNGAPTAPQCLAGTSTSFENEERGDLIKFYNTVYIQKIQSFAIRLSSRSNQNDQLPLSPIPKSRSCLPSPTRRVSENLFIKPLVNTNFSLLPNSPAEPLSYFFSRSPAKDLRAINNMISFDNHRIGKRLLADDSSDGASLPKQARTPEIVARKLQGLLGDRLTQAQE